MQRASSVSVVGPEPTYLPTYCAYQMMLRAHCMKTTYTSNTTLALMIIKWHCTNHALLLFEIIAGTVWNFDLHYHHEGHFSQTIDLQLF